MTLHWSGGGAAPLMSPRQDETSGPLLYARRMAGPYRCKDATRGRNDDPVTSGIRARLDRGRPKQNRSSCSPQKFLKVLVAQRRSNGLIQMVDDSHYMLDLNRSKAKSFEGCHLSVRMTMHEVVHEMVVGECHELNSEGSGSAWKAYMNARVAGLFLLYLQNEHYALWEVIEFEDSYEVPKESAATGSASDGKKERTVAITTEDMQKRRNDVKARTMLLLALPDEHQLRFSKYKMTQELWAAILKTFGGNEATKKTKKNLLKQQYGNFKAEGKEMLEQTFNRLQAIISQLEFMDVE
nr:ribonuclease H-like domain-containing protein [Tanacetum cinerariifolium]